MKPVINMRFLTMIFTILLIIAFLSMAWPFILAMLVIMAVLGIFGMFKIKKMTKTMNDQWSSMDQNQDSLWIDEQTQDSPFEQRVAQPEVFEAEYTERRTDEDGRQSDTKGL